MIGPTTYDPAAGVLVAVGTNGMPRSGYFPDRNNWAPRVGVAWSPPAGHGGPRRIRNLLRPVFACPGEGLYFNKPYYDFNLYFPLPGMPLTLGDPFPSHYPVSLPGSALGFDRDLRTPYMQHWNLTIERQFGDYRVVEVAYVGSKGSKILAGRDINQPAPSPQQPNLRPVPQFCGHHLSGIARQFQLPQPAGALSAADASRICRADVVHTGEVARHRFDIFLERRGREFPSEQLESGSRKRAVEFRRAPSDVGRFLLRICMRQQQLAPLRVVRPGNHLGAERPALHRRTPRRDRQQQHRHGQPRIRRQQPPQPPRFRQFWRSPRRQGGSTPVRSCLRLTGASEIQGGTSWTGRDTRM